MQRFSDAVHLRGSKKIQQFAIRTLSTVVPDSIKAASMVAMAILYWHNAAVLQQQAFCFALVGS